LKDIMSGIHGSCAQHRQEKDSTNYYTGANIVGSERVSKAMMAYGTL
jgi:glutamate dehydrogenase/leucine dehydrogenase